MTIFQSSLLGLTIAIKYLGVTDRLGFYNMLFLLKRASTSCLIPSAHLDNKMYFTNR
jgi:hypothetical protein